MPSVGTRQSGRQLGLGAVVLGLGLGGLFDGIVFHQILQWHHMVSTQTPPTTIGNLELNTLADGIFHAAGWLLTVVGAFALVSRDAGRPDGAGRPVAGGVLVGWGMFNTVEGLVDHHLLKLHHVRPGPGELAYDLAFLAWGMIMLAVGIGLSRRDQPRATSAGERSLFG